MHMHIYIYIHIHIYISMHACMCKRHAHSMIGGRSNVIPLSLKIGFSQSIVHLPFPSRTTHSLTKAEPLDLPCFSSCWKTFKKWGGQLSFLIWWANHTILLWSRNTPWSSSPMLLHLWCGCSGSWSAFSWFAFCWSAFFLSAFCWSAFFWSAFFLSAFFWSAFFLSGSSGSLSFIAFELAFAFGLAFAFFLAVGSSAAAGFFWIPVLTQTTYSTLKDALNVKVCQSWQVWPSKWASRVSDKGQLLCVHNFVGCTYNLKDLNNTKCAHSRTCTDNLKDLKTTKGAHSRTCTDNLKDLNNTKCAASRTCTDNL